MDDFLKGKRIALGVTGSVAAIEAPKIAREMARRGAEVTAYMTPDAQGIITADVMEFATGRPVVTRLTGKVEHLDTFDLVLIAPVTANTIAKMTHGMADNPLTCLVLSTKAPLVLAPGMQEDMWANPILQENVDKLRGLGMAIVDPRMEEGKAKMASLGSIVDRVTWALSKKDLEGKSVLVTAGPTTEAIDPVRVITNRSSGKMGIALAREAYYRGAEVHLIMGPGTAEVPDILTTTRVETAAQMLDAVKGAIDDCDIFISAAAVADFTVKPSDKKLDSRGGSISLDLAPTAKILVVVKDSKTVKCGFKALSDVSEEELVEAARRLLEETGLSLVVANDISSGVFGSDENEVYLVDEKGAEHLPRMSKDRVASAILDRLAGMA